MDFESLTNVDPKLRREAMEEAFNDRILADVKASGPYAARLDFAARVLTATSPGPDAGAILMATIRVAAVLVVEVYAKGAAFDENGLQVENPGNDDVVDQAMRLFSGVGHAEMRAYMETMAEKNRGG